MKCLWSQILARSPPRTQAPSTRIRRFLYPQIFLCGYKNICVHTYPDTQCIQKFPLWRAYTEISGYTERIRRTRVDARCIRIKIFADTKISGYVWTGPYLYETANCANGSLTKFLGLFWSKKLKVKFSRVYIRFMTLIKH